MPRKIVYNDTSSSSYLNEVKSAHLYLSPPNTNTKKKITVFRDVISEQKGKEVVKKRNN